MKKQLESHQKEALSKIVSAYENNIGKCCFYMPTGTGVARTLSISIVDILNKKPSAKILVLFLTKPECLQFISNFSDISNKYICSNTVSGYYNQSILSITYNSYFINYEKLKNNKFDVIICFNAERINSAKYNPILTTECNLLLGVFSLRQYDKKNLFLDSSFIYESKNIVFYDWEVQYLENLIVPMLKHLNYQDFETNNRTDVLGKIINFDLTATKDGVNYYIDVKAYKGAFNDKKIVWNAIEQTLKNKSLANYNDTAHKFGIILLCVIDEKLKKEIVENYGIFIWDIKNLLYICSEVTELSEKLQDMIPYSLNRIVSAKPISIDNSTKIKTSFVTESTYGKELISKLKNCKTSQTTRSAQEYEEICSSIIKYLFKSEFPQFSEQHKTNDEMFRMDIICSLKGTTAFWEFLIRYYNTKFIVFECKNYKDKLKQNLIYITEKYLFNPALRNVAFIISRNGFSSNAQKAAIGILKDQGKLIIDLTDNDLEIMINAKIEGNEPSDYLLDKIEKLLMGISV
ncbi:MAG: DEAD/DEAH box helicase family protein [Clostridia bacterium]|nr:DEAD/DEAH box helicase family protein [Clostridia bacterium]